MIDRAFLRSEILSLLKGWVARAPVSRIKAAAEWRSLFSTKKEMFCRQRKK